MAFPSQSGQMRNYGATDENRIPNVEVVGTQFSPTELYSLCENITTNVYTINSSFKQLDEALKAFGTSRDNQGLRDKVHVTQLSTNQIISQTTKDLQRLTVVVRKGDRQQKLQVEKLTNRFKEEVKSYSLKQKQVADKMKHCLLPSEVATLEEGGDDWMKSDENYRQLAKQKQKQQELEFEQGMLIEQAQRVKQIEEDVLDVNEIMRELSAMVFQQTESINLIENAVDDVHSSVDQGRQELEKAAAYQARRRTKTVCMLSIVIVIVLIVGFFIFLGNR
uniref:t-SNARE coiled-coil homology domain-containing protein n=1 Tax=Clastoptera arizonana TaxID=38151 RepID=A0A1B6DV26_9HEMI